MATSVIEDSDDIPIYESNIAYIWGLGYQPFLMKENSHSFLPAWLENAVDKSWSYSNLTMVALLFEYIPEFRWYFLSRWKYLTRIEFDSESELLDRPKKELVFLLFEPLLVVFEKEQDIRKTYHKLMSRIFDKDLGIEDKKECLDQVGETLQSERRLTSSKFKRMGKRKRPTHRAESTGASPILYNSDLLVPLLRHFKNYSHFDIKRYSRSYVEGWYDDAFEILKSTDLTTFESLFLINSQMLLVRQCLLGIVYRLEESFFHCSELFEAKNLDWLKERLQPVKNHLLGIIESNTSSESSDREETEE